MARAMASLSCTPCASLIASPKPTSRPSLKKESKKNARLAKLFKYFHLKPKELRTYELAFTHPSYNLDAKSCHEDYERLEFLGDSILGASVADLAFQAHPDKDQVFYKNFAAHWSIPKRSPNTPAITI